ncbi:hypothetical protein BAE44_0004669, partial [Dichanthelium oligosanthes]
STRESGLGFPGRPYVVVDGDDQLTTRRCPTLPATTSQVLTKKAADISCIAGRGAASATANERQEQCHKAEAKENVEVGTAFAVFGLAVLLALCLPQQVKHPGNVRLTVSLLFSLATFLAGKTLMLLSLNMLGLREDLVSGGQRVAAKCLRPACAFLSVMTLVSLLALLPGRVYLYIGLAVVAVIMSAAAGAHWYLCRCTDGGGEAASYEEELNDDKEVLEAA